jgi:hypothetical protein
VLDTRAGKIPIPNEWPQEPLAFIDWYSPLPSSPDENKGAMYDIRNIQNLPGSRRPGAVVPLSNIRQSCMLIPRFPAQGVPKDWSLDNVLDKATHFFVNNWSSKYNYQTIW